MSPGGGGLRLREDHVIEEELAVLVIEKARILLLHLKFDNELLHGIALVIEIDLVDSFFGLHLSRAVALASTLALISFLEVKREDEPPVQNLPCWAGHRASLPWEPPSDLGAGTSSRRRCR